MPKYEYKVVTAPKKGVRARGVKGTNERFANTLMALMNEYGREGWEYQRTDTLPCEERSGLTGKSTTFQNMLIFRRELEDADSMFKRHQLEAEVEMPVLAVPTHGSTPDNGPRLNGADKGIAGKTVAVIGPAAPKTQTSEVAAE